MLSATSNVASGTQSCIQNSRWSCKHTVRNNTGRSHDLKKKKKRKPEETYSFQKVIFLARLPAFINLSGTPPTLKLSFFLPLSASANIANAEQLSRRHFGRNSNSPTHCICWSLTTVCYGRHRYKGPSIHPGDLAYVDGCEGSQASTCYRQEGNFLA